MDMLAAACAHATLTGRMHTQMRSNKPGRIPMVATLVALQSVTHLEQLSGSCCFGGSETEHSSTSSSAQEGASVGGLTALLLLRLRTLFQRIGSSEVGGAEEEARWGMGSPHSGLNSELLTLLGLCSGPVKG